MCLPYCRGMIREAIWTLKGKQKSLKYCLHAAHSTTAVFVHYNMRWRRPVGVAEDGTKQRTKQQKHTWERGERASSGTWDENSIVRKEGQGETSLLKATLTLGTGLGKNQSWTDQESLSLPASFHSSRKCWERKESSDLPQCWSPVQNWPSSQDFPKDSTVAQ